MYGVAQGKRMGHLNISCDKDNTENLSVHELELERLLFRATGF